MDVAHKRNDMETMSDVIRASRRTQDISRRDMGGTKNSHRSG